MKRLFDFLFGLIAALVLLPIFCLLAFLVQITIGTPILFVQTRSGLNGKPLTMIKFRSAANAQNGDGSLFAESERLTRFGQFLRATSIDELPELWNVLKGEMSLVGPRSLLMGYLSLYSPGQARCHSMRYEIMGWAQMNDRSAIAWGEKFKLDVRYVDNHSFWLDVKILFLTVKSGFRRHGVTAGGEVTMRPFTRS